MWGKLDSASRVYTQEKRQNQSSESELLVKAFHALVEVLVISPHSKTEFTSVKSLEF